MRANYHCLSGGYEIFQPTWWSMEHATIETGISSVDIGAQGFYSCFLSRDVSTKNPRYSRTSHQYQKSQVLMYLPLYHTSFIGVPPSLLVPGLRFPGDTTPFGGLVLTTLAPRSWHKSVPRLGLESGEANLGIVPSEQTPVTWGHLSRSTRRRILPSADSHCYAVLPRMNISSIHSIIV